MPCNVMNDKLWPYNTFQSGNINKKNKNKYIKNMFTLCVFYSCCFSVSLLSWSIVHNLARQLISALNQYLEYLEYYHLFLEYEHVHPCNHVGTCRDFFKRWQLHHWSRLLTAAVACSLDLADAADVLKMQNDAIHFCRPVDFQLKQETSEASPQAIVF